MTTGAPASFWSALGRLVATCAIVVDRQAGTRHPRYPEAPPYPLDYGYLKGVGGNDGGHLDCWMGSGPDRAVTGIVITVDLLKRDAEVKVLVGCTAEEMGAARGFCNTGPMAAILVARPADCGLAEGGSGGGSTAEGIGAGGRGGCGHGKGPRGRRRRGSPG